MPSAWQEHRIRVRYQETDQMGVVYHTNYLNWFEWGRTEWVRTYGFTYQQLEEQGLLLPVYEASMKLHASATYDQELIIRTRLLTLQPMMLRFESEIRPADSPDRLIASGWTEHVWMNRNRKIIRLDRQAPSLYEAMYKAWREVKNELE